MPLIWSLFCFCASVSLSACRWVCLPPATFWMLIFLFVTLSVCWPSYPVPLKISLCLLILVASQPCLIVLDVSCMDDCLSACQPLCLCVFLFGKVVNVWRPLLPIYKKLFVWYLIVAYFGIYTVPLQNAGTPANTPARPKHFMTMYVDGRLFFPEQNSCINCPIYSKHWLNRTLPYPPSFRIKLVLYYWCCSLV